MSKSNFAQVLMPTNVGLALLVALSVGGIMFAQFRAYIMDSKKEYLSTVIAVVANDYRGELENIEDIIEAGEENSEDFQRLNTKLTHIAALAGITDVYYLHIKDGMVAFVLTGSYITIEGKAVLWGNYFDIDYIDSAINTAIREKKAVVGLNPITNERGTRISAYVPLVRHGSGELIGIMGADYVFAEAEIQFSAAARTLLAALIVALVIVALVSFHTTHLLKNLEDKANAETARAEAASKAKSEFLASMSHEIRTPMNAVVGMSSLMRTDNLDDVQKSYLTDIKKVASSLMGIINDILDFSRIEAGKMDLLPTHYSFYELFDNLASLSGFTASAKSLAFTSSRSDEIPEFLYGDEIRVRQIATNLLNNAIKYTREGTVDFTASKDGPMLILIVSDTGIGIKPEDMGKLFGTFAQLDQSKNRGIVGTGLGLSIVKRLCTMMGGTVDAVSEYGKGSVFTARIPLVPGDPDKVEKAQADFRVMARSDTAVLVVDDNTVNIRVAQGFLKQHGITPDTATSGQQAIDMICAKDYDLVFMDHMMSEMDGTEASEKIRALGGRNAEMPIVALSANAITGIREIFLAAGMNDFLPKPIEAKALNRILRAYLPPDKIISSSDDEGPKDPEKSGETSLFDALGAVSDLNVGIGLSHIGEDREAYLDILRHFCATLEGEVAALEEDERKADWKNYAIHVHGLKGVFANIGGESIREWAYNLELAAKGGETHLCVEQTALLCKRMRAFREDLLKTGIISGAAEKKQSTIADIRFLLDALKAACSAGSGLRAAEITGSLRALTVDAAVDAVLDRIASCVDDYDFEKALGEIEGLLEA